MSFASFGNLSVFDHNLNTWKTYKNRLTQWFIANDVNNGNDPIGVKRRAILLSALSEGTYKLASDLALPKELQEVPYEDIVSLLDSHFTPKQIGFSERHKFYAATQQEMESPAQWVARLRGLTAQCNFSNLEETLRDRFIMGMLPGAEKEKMYVQDLAGFTLAKAVNLAESLRGARAAAISAAGAPPAPPAALDHEQLFKIAQPSGTEDRRGGKVKCSVCGYTNHKAESCRFANYTCRKCNIKGHLRRMCKKVNYVSTVACEVNEDDDDDGKLFNIRTIKGEPLVETVLINGQKLRFEIDSGSAVTVMSEGTYKSHFKDMALKRNYKKINKLHW
ncbi:uncharacterized protein LOC114354821 [Ostrinia furnacalis]|uniref:uncharacterized protein LOC114354821 n=1 Tax=Ostrinia furnacalis TaxID=93504 RepID=UPI00103E7EBC|nr:uncharacterized protein LOC114354821 [Ostrinia furnacalis]